MSFQIHPNYKKNSKWSEPVEAGQNNFKMQAVPFQIRAKTQPIYEQRTRIITVESHLEVEAGKPVDHGHLGRIQHLTF